MKYQTYLCLIGAATAVQIRQPLQPGMPSNNQMCQHAPTAADGMGPPTGKQCSTGEIVAWASPISPATTCSWSCIMPAGGPPMPAYHPPSKAE